DTGENARGGPLRETDDSGEVCRSDRPLRRLRHETLAIVAEHTEPPAAPRSDDQVFVTVAIVVVPRDAGPELRQRVGEQELTLPVVEHRVDVRVSAELRGRVLEQCGDVRRVLCRRRGDGRRLSNLI